MCYNNSTIMERIDRKLIDEKYREITFELLSVLQEHSIESYIHSLDVAEKSCAIAKALKVGGDDLKNLYTASLLHDIGKIFVSESLLHKHNATDEERKIIQNVHINGTKQILDEYFDEAIVNIAFNHILLASCC